MKWKQKITALLITTFMVFSVSLVAVAQPQKGRNHEGGMFNKRMHGFGGIEKFAEELELTEAQQTKLKALRFEGQKEAVAKRADIKIARIELRELMEADKTDEGAIKKQVEKIGQLRTDKMLALVEKKLAVKNILTDEQEAKLKELRKDRVKRFQRGKRGERRGGKGFGANEESFDGYFFGGVDEDYHFDPPTEAEKEL